MIAQTIMQRKPKADVARQFIGVLSRSKEGKPKTLVVPGSNGRQYHVIIRRDVGQQLITLECNLMAGPLGMVPCQGNGVLSICYHCRAALDYAVCESGLNTAWCGDLQTVRKLGQLHKDARWYNVRSHQSGKQMYVITYRKGEK